MRRLSSYKDIFRDFMKTICYQLDRNFCDALIGEEHLVRFHQQRIAPKLLHRAFSTRRTSAIHGWEPLELFYFRNTECDGQRSKANVFCSSFWNHIFSETNIFFPKFYWKHIFSDNVNTVLSRTISAFGVRAATESTTRISIAPERIRLSAISNACSPLSG